MLAGNEYLQEPLIIAAREGNLACVQELLPNVQEMRIVRRAFVYTASIQVAAFLLSSGGIDVNAADEHHRRFGPFLGDLMCPALAYACKENMTQKALWLLSKGADPNLHYYEKKLVAGMADIDEINFITPLAFAVEKKNVELIRALLAAGAKADVLRLAGDVRSSGHSLTILGVALQDGLSGGCEIIDILLEAGANVNDTNAKGQTALILAMETGMLGLVKHFVEKGADVNKPQVTKKDVAPQTPLSLALKYGFKEIAEYLRRQGAHE